MHKTKSAKYFICQCVYIVRVKKLGQEKKWDYTRCICRAGCLKKDLQTLRWVRRHPVEKKKHLAPFFFFSANFFIVINLNGKVCILFSLPTILWTPVGSRITQTKKHREKDLKYAHKMYSFYVKHALTFWEVLS